MRRRRPSALYTVLDEEQLLAGVDLADHPDPLAGRAADEPSADWDDWSPDPEDDFLPPPGGPSSGSPGRDDAAGPRRRRWLTLGFICALGVVLLVAREIGAALDTAGTRPGSRPAAALPTAGSPTAGSPTAGSPTTGSGALVGGAAVPRVPTPSRSARVLVRARGVQRPAAARGSIRSATTAGGPTRLATAAGGSTTAPPTRTQPPPAVGPSPSPVQEFGFER